MRITYAIPSEDSIIRARDIVLEANGQNEKGFFHNTEEYFSTDNIKKHLGSDGFLLFAEDEGEDAGTVSVCIEENRQSVKKILGEEISPHFRFVGVISKFQGKGIAKGLLAEAIEICRDRGYKNILVNTSYANKPAIGLYKKCGFREFDIHVHDDFFVITLVYKETGKAIFPIHFLYTYARSHFHLLKRKVKLFIKKKRNVSIDVE